MWGPPLGLHHITFKNQNPLKVSHQLQSSRTLRPIKLIIVDLLGPQRHNRKQINSFCNTNASEHGARRWMMSRKHSHYWSGPIKSSLNWEKMLCLRAVGARSCVRGPVTAVKQVPSWPSTFWKDICKKPWELLTPSLKQGWSSSPVWPWAETWGGRCTRPPPPVCSCLLRPGSGWTFPESSWPTVENKHRDFDEALITQTCLTSSF